MFISILYMLWAAMCPSGLDETCFIQTCIPDGRLHTATYTRCRIDTINSPDDGHIAVRNV